jgi:hypothetical protein
MMKHRGAITSPAARRRSPAIRPFRAATCIVTILACVPYLVLKVLWLAGHPVGATDTAGAGALLDARHLAGNLVSGAMELVAIALVMALTYPWGRRLPAALVLVPAWLGTGLLAPIALGLPLGLVAQALVGGSPAPTGNGLDGWVFAVVYGGFIVQAVGLVAAFVGHALDRWPAVLRMQTAQLRAVDPGQCLLATIAVAGVAGYAALFVVWSVAGPGWGGPAGFDTVAQKTVLLSTGLVVLIGALAALALVWRRGTGRILAPLALAWLGTGVTVTSGPAHVALSNGGAASPLLVLATLAAVPAGLIVAAAAARALAHSPLTGTEPTPRWP